MKGNCDRAGLGSNLVGTLTLAAGKPFALVIERNDSARAAVRTSHKNENPTPSNFCIMIRCRAFLALFVRVEATFSLLCLTLLIQ
jgi:hypothetical protein